jgi:hypothetical protein
VKKRTCGPKKISKIMEKKEISTLKSILRYDPLTGDFTWLFSANKKRIGQVAGVVCKDSGVRIMAEGKNYHAHRLAWVFSYGPIGRNDLISHKDGNRQNNRLENLVKTDMISITNKKDVTIKISGKSYRIPKEVGEYIKSLL